MSYQPPFDPFAPSPGIVGRRHPDTSRAAAAEVMPRTGTLRRMVLDYLTARGAHGATDGELQWALKLAGNTERPRRLELVEVGLVNDSGRRRDGQIVWTTDGVAVKPPIRPGINKWSRRVQAVSANCPMSELTDDEVNEILGAATFLRNYCLGELIRRKA